MNIPGQFNVEHPPTEHNKILGNDSGALPPVKQSSAVIPEEYTPTVHPLSDAEQHEASQFGREAVISDRNATAPRRTIKDVKLELEEKIQAYEMRQRNSDKKV